MGERIRLSRLCFATAGSLRVDAPATTTLISLSPNAPVDPRSSLAGPENAHVVPPGPDLR
jgi:hypothetical protein